MAQTLPKMVKAKSGVEYDAASPQGQMIANSAKPAFSADAKILMTISANVISIGESVAAMAMIAQADARGDALNKSNVVQDVTNPTAELTSGQMRDRGEGGGDDGGLGALAGLGGLMGIGGVVGAFGKGLSFWGTPLAIAGALTFVTFLGGLALVGFAGALSFEKSAPRIAAGMEALSDADVDPEKVIQMGKALAAFGGAMAAKGLGEGISGLGTLVGGIADGLAGFLGIEKKDPMVALKAFAQYEISEDELKQIGINARALTTFSAAMTVSSIGEGFQSIADLVSGVALGIGEFFNLPKGKDPMDKLARFAREYQFTEAEVENITQNALALVAFTTTMATVKSITLIENIANLASGVVLGMASLFPKDVDPMIKMRTFADHIFTDTDVKQVKLNAEALLAFSSVRAVTAPLGTVAAFGDLMTGVATGIGKLFGLDAPDPMKSLKKFAETTITPEESKQINLNAKSLVEFSKAMAFYKASGAVADSLALVGNMAKGISDFFGADNTIDYEEIKTFAGSGIGDLEPKITANALALSRFSTALKDANIAQTEINWANIKNNILGGIGALLGGTAEENLMKNFGAIEEFTATELDLDRVDNNIMAINKFMEFGASWVNFKGGDFKAVGKFAESLVRSANGIHTAMYGGEYAKGGLNMNIDEGKGLAAVDLGDMSDASMGIAVLRHALVSNAPLQELQKVTAEMNTSTGGVTVIAPTDNSIKNSSSSISTAELDANARQSAIDAFMATQSVQ